jgi:dolichol-phosphate mannosyltransferase
MPMTSLIIIPTYNEKDNLENLAGRIFAACPDMKILIVDDNSPDGTGEAADKMAAADKRMHVLHRAKKEGIGKAYLDGFRYAVKNTDAYYIMTMDADSSHDPAHIPAFLEKIKNCDVVIGSRYCGGRISIVNWPLSRLILSYGASVYVRLCARLSLRDPTSGFRCFRRYVVDSLLENKIISDSYSFLIEINYVCGKLGYKIEETPIIFYERDRGLSKMCALSAALDAVLIVWKVKFKKYKKAASPCISSGSSDIPR